MLTKELNKIFTEAEQSLPPLPKDAVVSLTDFFSVTDVPISEGAFVLNPLPTISVPFPIERQRVYRARILAKDLVGLELESARSFLTTLRASIVRELVGFRIVELRFGTGVTDSYLFQHANGDQEFRAFVRYSRWPK